MSDFDSSAAVTHGQPAGRGRSAILIIGALVVLAAVGLGAYALLGKPNGGPNGTTAPGVIAQFDGDGDKTSDAFRVDEGWQILWETTGETFEFAIAGDTDFGTVIQQAGPGSGITSPVGAGTFRLEITAKGPWSIQIVQGQP